MGHADRLMGTISNDVFDCGTLMEFFRNSLSQTSTKILSEESCNETFRSFEVSLNELMEKKLVRLLLDHTYNLLEKLHIITVFMYLKFRYKKRNLEGKC